MNKLTNKPYLIFLLSIPLLLIAGFLKGDSTFDLNIYDTYFVIAKTYLAWLIAMIFGVIGLVYLLIVKSNRKLSKWLTGIHIVLTFGGFLLTLVLAQFYKEDNLLSNYNDNLTATITLIILIIILVQIIFPINIIYAFVKKKTSN